MNKIKNGYILQDQAALAKHSKTIRHTFIKQNHDKKRNNRIRTHYQ